MTAFVLMIIVGFLFAAGLASYIVALYNGLVAARNNFEKAFSNIDVLLEQRHDELPKLVNAAKGYMKHEQALLTDIVKQRMRYQKASDIGEKVQAENQLVDLMGRFNLLVEQYPDLKAVASFNHLQTRISQVEGQVADRREMFNDTINIFNTRVEQFPDVILARILKYDRKASLEVPENKKEDLVEDDPDSYVRGEARRAIAQIRNSS